MTKIEAATLEAKELSVDPFYSESNMEHLRRGISVLNVGKVIEHEPIEVDYTKWREEHLDDGLNVRQLSKKAYEYSQKQR